MAFRQPAFHAPQRIYTAPNESQAQAPTSPQHTQPLEESQEWILFSPTAASTTDRTYTASTGRTRTVGRSRISDLGSLDTKAGYEEGYSEDAIEEEEEEDGELDSLDSHLHEFRSEPSVWRGNGEREMEKSGTVLPTHDGLGGFRMTENVVQEHLYAFERFNPRRVKRRREGEGILDEESERAAEVERTRRVEEWRMEQSRLLVDEIQKETRRRKQSITSERRSVVEDREHEDVATMSNVDGSVEDVQENESFWNRITRRVIRDLMGIDDDLLSIIFGETLPEDDDLSSTPQATSPFDAAHSLIAKNQQYDQSSWEYRLLDRIARELGILVNQLTDHPGAFTTYLQTATAPLPYAGLPAIPESSNTPLLPAPQGLQTPTFEPTLQTQPLSIPGLTNTSFSAPLAPEDATPRATAPISREEWERDLDLKMVFRYLRSRFVSKFQFSSPTTPSSFTPSHLATASTADTAARAARVRQHHPLVHERRERTRPRTWRVSVPGSEKVGSLRRRGSSCASEHLSALGGGKRSGSWSSTRHYWDFGGSAGGSKGGSMVVSTGGMGSWGEV
jgi:hypothetical protein